MRESNQKKYWLILLFLLFVGSYFLLVVGDGITNQDLMKWFFGDLGTNAELILSFIRLPKLFLLIGVGAALALSGFLIQHLTNNPLADPYLLGTASGAALGVNLGIAGFLPMFLGYFSSMLLYGFVFGLLTTILVVLVSIRKERINQLVLIIAGVSMSSILTAFTSLVIYYSDSTSKLRSMLFWAMGSFEKASWGAVPIFYGVLCSCGLVALFMHKHLNILMLGRYQASQLAGGLRKIQLIILLIVCLLVSASVSICGPIGFIGLIIPHFTRSFMGVSNKQILIFTLLSGSVFLVVCELLAQLIVPSIGLPVGVVSSFVGMPFFLYLLLNKKYRFG